MATNNATWVLQAALQGLSAPSGKEFLLASRFAGAKPGYVFKVDEHGLGYYLDPHQAAMAGEGGDGAGPSGESRSAPVQQLDPEELLRQAEEEANIDQIQALDAKSLRRLVAGLDKKYKENMGLRLKYADQPDRFLESEVDLDEAIKGLMQVAGSPELYPVLLDGPCLPTLLALLGHENTDVAADVVELLAEMTGADAAAEYGEEAAGLVGALVDANGPELLVQRMAGFREEVDEEAKAVNNCLAVVENMVEIQPDLANLFVDKTKVLTWLLKRLKKREFDGNKQYASEVLAVLMQGNVANQARLGAENGIDVLLTCVAQYKSRDPAPGEEEEYMQNCFDVLCACLMQPEHKVAFGKAEGVELMLLMLQSRRQCRYGALKCLDYAATRYAPPCDKLVDLGGLKQLFGLFMGKAKVKGPLGEHDVEQEVEQRCVSLIASLCMQLPAAGRGGARRERLLAKFVESEFEKTDRLMELLFRYQARVRAEELRLEAALAHAQEGEQVDDDELLLARMDAGLFTLQQCCVVFGSLWATGEAGLRRRLLGLLHQKGQTLGPVREVLLEFLNSIGTEGGLEEANRTRGLVRRLLESLGAQLEEDTGEGAQAEADDDDAMDVDADVAVAAAAAGQRRKADAALMPPPPPPPGAAAKPRAPASAPAPAAAAAGEARPAGGEAGGRGRGGEEGELEDGEAAAGPAPSRAAERGSDRDGGSDRDRDRGRERDRDGQRERERDEEKEREKEGRGGRDKDRDREKEEERERERGRDRDREASRRDRESERDDSELEARRKGGREKEREKDKDRERDREKEREREKERDREREKEREGKDRDREREGKEKSREKDKERDRERDKDKEKDRDRERDRRDRDRDRR